MTLKPLGIIKEIVESIGMNISYAHEDLVFMEHNAFLLQFTSENDKLLIHKNKEADDAIIESEINKLTLAAQQQAITIDRGTMYQLSQENDENIRIEFF